MAMREGKRALIRRMREMQSSGQTLFMDNLQKGQALAWVSEQFKGVLQRFPAIRDDRASQELLGFMNDVQRQLAIAEKTKREKLREEKPDGATKD